MQSAYKPQQIHYAKIIWLSAGLILRNLWTANYFGEIKYCILRSLICSS